jgi:hypothetical protein
MGGTIARPKQLPDTLQEHDFHVLAKTESHPRTRIRFLGRTCKRGGNHHKIATALRVLKITVQAWVQRFKEEGLDD